MEKSQYRNPSPSSNFLSEFEFDLSVENYRALEFIQQYQGYPQFIGIPLNIAGAFLKTDDNAIEAIISKKIFYDGFEDRDKQTIPVSIMPQNTPFLDTYLTKMSEEFEFTPKESVNLAFEFYIQSFVDSYHDYYDNGITLHFSPFETVKKRAMNNNEQQLLRTLCQRDNYISGFDTQGVITCSQLKLESILKRYCIS